MLEHKDVNTTQMRREDIMIEQIVRHVAPAKVNLGLRVLGIRADGYHILRTVFCLIDLFDEIDFQITRDQEITLIQQENLWHYTEDLAYRAATLLQEYTDCMFGASIRIKKNIPTGSGLGGGSSDAATVLLTLNRLWQTKLSTTELMHLGVQLGADVPFFIYGNNAMGDGIGDALTSVTIPKTYFVLVKPKCHISTKEVFLNLKLTSGITDLNSITANSLMASCTNDLQETACKLYPELYDLLSNLKSYGDPHMTGSGSVVFLRFTSLEAAKKVAQQLANGYNTWLVESLDSSPALNTCL